MKVIALQDWVPDRYLPIAVIDRTVRQLGEEHGFGIEAYLDGLGEAEGQLLELDDGQRFLIEQHMQASDPYRRQTDINCLFASDEEGKQKLLAVLRAFNVQPQDLVWAFNDATADLREALQPSSATTAKSPSSPFLPTRPTTPSP